MAIGLVASTIATMIGVAVTSAVTGGGADPVDTWVPWLVVGAVLVSLLIGGLLVIRASSHRRLNRVALAADSVRVSPVELDRDARAVIASRSVAGVGVGRRAYLVATEDGLEVWRGGRRPTRVAAGRRPGVRLEVADEGPELVVQSFAGGTFRARPLGTMLRSRLPRQGAVAVAAWLEPWSS